MADWRVVYAQLAAFEDRRAVTNAIRRAIREPVPDIRYRILTTALGTMPHRGGLNVWVASIKIKSSVVVKARQVGLKLRGGRTGATDKKSDIKRIDGGTVRAPSWGRRGRGQWHAQRVEPEFFTGSAAQAFPQVEAATTAAVEAAFKTLGG